MAGNDEVMPGYGEFARFYDCMMDDPLTRSAWVVEHIDRYMPEAASLLELGCGTGSVLAGLRAVPSLTGLDLSPEMLAIARAKVPAARFIEGDMASFDLGEQFDTVICVFDTVNHLPDFNHWASFFERVHAHLVQGGLFMFDVNTLGRLRRLAEGLPLVHDFDGNTLIVCVEPAGDDMSVWDVKVLRDAGGDQAVLCHERICELGVELDRIVTALSSHFELLEKTDPLGGTPTDESERAYFVVRKRRSVVPVPR